jgi:hypothetical protein
MTSYCVTWCSVPSAITRSARQGKCVFFRHTELAATFMCESFVKHIPFSVALPSLEDLGLLTYRRFLELFRHMVGLLGRVISPSQGLYLHRTTQHRKTLTNIHALSGIRTHDPSNQPTPQTARPLWPAKLYIKQAKYGDTFKYGWIITAHN